MKTTYRGWELRAGVETLCQKINVAFDIDAEPVVVTWSSGTSTAAINQWGRIVMANVLDEAVVSRAVFEKYCGFAVHELLHRHYTNFNAIGDGAYIRTLHNAVEDIWIERRGIAANLTGNIEGLLTNLINLMVGEALEGVEDWSDPRQYPFALAVYGRRYANKVPLALGLEPIFKEASDRIDHCLNSRDTLEVAQWVYSQLEQLDKQDNQDEQGEQDKQGKQGEQGDECSQEGSGEGQDGDQGDGEGDGSVQAEDGSERGTSGSDSDKVGRAKSPSGIEADSANVEPCIEAPPGAEAVGYFSESYALCSKENHLSGEPTRNVAQSSVPAKLRYEVKRLFENSGTESFQMHRRAGSLNVHALPTVAMGNTDVFKRRQDVEGVDSSVTVLLDISGSMFFDGVIDSAIKTSLALLETLEKAQVKTCLMTFGDHASVQKGFDVPVKRILADMNRLCDGGGTADYDALRVAHGALYRRSEGRKVVFVITDGESNGDRALREQIASGEALGITTIAIGICANVSRVYPKSITINDVDELGSVSFKQIKLAA
jgi:Mg-chelatase subunit ChlD